MGYAVMVANCWVCRKLFSFNPRRVPSIRDEDGVFQPVCRECVEMANRIRVVKELKPFIIPDDAYSPCDECEI